MSRQVVIALISGAVVVAGIVVFLSFRPAPSTEEAASPSAPSGLDAPVPSPAPSSSATGAPEAPRPTPRGAGSTPAAAATPDAPAAAPEAAAPLTGVLTIQSDVPGAQVFIDRRFIGSTPVTIDDVAPGSHQLNLSAEGFDGIARTIEVAPGPRDITIRFREVRLDAALAVVHRHRIGSCNGRLVASADGIRYETTNKDDGFRVALGDLEVFEIDYQERNLRLKVRNGRDYNFADPEKDADRLFVFHRDVERARGQLAKGYQPAAD